MDKSISMPITTRKPKNIKIDNKVEQKDFYKQSKISYSVSQSINNLKASKQKLANAKYYENGSASRQGAKKQIALKIKSKNVEIINKGEKKGKKDSNSDNQTLYISYNPKTMYASVKKQKSK